MQYSLSSHLQPSGDSIPGPTSRESGTFLFRGGAICAEGWAFLSRLRAERPLGAFFFQICKGRLTKAGLVSCRRNEQKGCANKILPHVDAVNRAKLRNLASIGRSA